MRGGGGGIAKKIIGGECGKPRIRDGNRVTLNEHFFNVFLGSQAQNKGTSKGKKKEGGDGNTYGEL